MPSAEDCATLQAYAAGPLHAARRAEETWGVGRLPLLVDAELRARFERQAVRWHQALEAAWETERLTAPQLDDVAKKAGAMERAWAVMDAAASEAGHSPIAPDAWEAVMRDGTVVALVKDTADAHAVLASGRQVAVWTVQEFANIIDAIPQFLNDAKVVFPGAKIVTHAAGHRTTSYDDPVPF